MRKYSRSHRKFEGSVILFSFNNESHNVGNVQMLQKLKCSPMLISFNKEPRNVGNVKMLRKM